MGRFGITPEVYVAFIWSKRVRGFKPRLAIEAKEAHGRLGRCRWRVWWGCVSSGLWVFGCHSRVERRSSSPNGRGPAVCFCRLGWLPVSCCLSGSKPLRQEPCLVGVVAGDLGKPGKYILLCCRRQGQAVAQGAEVGQVLVETSRTVGV